MKKEMDVYEILHAVTQGKIDAKDVIKAIENGEIDSTALLDAAEEEDFDTGIFIAAEEDIFVEEEIMNSTPESRKDWSAADWVYGIFWNCGLIYEEDCPISEFSPDEWAEIISSGSEIEAQFCPCPEKVLPLLSKEEFRHWSGVSVCTALVLCDWLGPLLPLENITQQDFDEILVCDPAEYPGEEDAKIKIEVKRIY